MSTAMTSQKRIRLVLGLTFCAAVLLIVRVFYIQLLWTELKEKGDAQRIRSIQVPAVRGAIYDRAGYEMAISIESESVYADPRITGLETDRKAGKLTIKEIVKDRAAKIKVAEAVANVLKVPAAELLSLIDSKASFVWIKRKTTPVEIDTLRALIKRKRIKGIAVSHSPQRFYPNRTLGAQLLGFVGIDNQGLEGVEKQFERYLRGIPGSDTAEFDILGRHIPQGNRRYIHPVPGDSIYLTIDFNIQSIVERELDKAVSDTASKRGMVMVIDPQSGEILALASRPEYDPNQYGEYPESIRRNPLFSDMYEPGSTFKVITAAAALEEGKVNPASTFYCPGYIIIENQRIQCWNKDGHGHQNFETALENSCNPAFATMALELDKERFYRYIKAFGFGKQSGVDFPGEAAGRLKPLPDIKRLELANIGFGQGISVTPLQLAMGVAAVANGGYLLKPQLIKEIRARDGRIKRQSRRQVVRQVISTSTAKMLSRMLESVVAVGSGSRAQLEGYRVAGKTGTAQKVLPGSVGYSQLIASFVGFAPVDNPRVLVVVILDEPGSDVKYGGVIAAPVAASIIRDTLRYMGIKPQYQPGS
jgi:stage V sporulation protein D (sporulation-specific penicillin-binding protein)